MPDVARILVVDDEPKIVQLVRDYLERAGFAVSTARDGNEALMRARQERPDLILLDLGLPGLDGLEVTRRLRRDSGVPIIMLTARHEETDKVVGLELGADDYVTKPFSPRELEARVRAVLRRNSRDVDADLLRAGDLTLDVPRLRGADHHAHRPPRGDRQGGRPRAGRRRLRDQALQPAHGPRPRAG